MKEMTLNAEQRQAVEFQGKHLLVLAGAGTGKTHTIVERAKYLLKNGVDPNRIVILSFTRKSASEIANRTKATVESAQELKGQTFHSWCAALIRSNPEVFRHENYTLIDEDDRRMSINRVLPAKLDKKAMFTETVIAVYSFAVNTLCSLTDSIRMHLYGDVHSKEVDEAIAKEKPVFEDVIRRYIAYKNEHNYLDYDDLLRIVATGLHSNSEARDFISQKYDHILIDEMQDTNPLQYKLLSSFYANCHLFCVGDDAQSIYAFRGADFKTIHNFAKEVEGAEVCKLTLNYRSTQYLLDLSNWLLKKSPLKYDKRLRAHRGGMGMKPLLIHCDDEYDEARDVVSRMLSVKKVTGDAWREQMVLSRTMFGMRRVELLCIEAKIPYKLFGGVGLMQSAHIRDVVSAMRIVNNFRDELAWMRYLTLWPNVGEVTAVKMLNHVMKGDDLDEALDRLATFIRAHAELALGIAQTLTQLKGSRLAPARAIKLALDGMYSILEHRYRDKDSWNEWRKGDFDILQDVAKRTESIDDFLEQYVLDPKLNETMRLQMQGDEDYVILSTIHSAKGLEAKYCYVLGVAPDKFPSIRAWKAGFAAIEEERRCLYVALTRAKDLLCVYRELRSVHGHREVELEECESYFLNGLPKKLTQHTYTAKVKLLKEERERAKQYRGTPVSTSDDFNFD